jgi:carbon-monoxide dehydrogenase medium subunit
LAGLAVAIKRKGGVSKLFTGATVEDAAIAITGVNPAPLLIPEAHRALLGKNLDDHAATIIGELAAKVAKPLTTSALTPEYRREMIRVFAKRALLDAARA